MPKEIYNEGRVVGMSAYEIYLRHQLSEYPELDPLTEREWLSATMDSGCSMILRVPKDTPAGVFDFKLPDDSTLCAATSITACVFDGQVTLDSNGRWATSVVSYGPLISNDSQSHPVAPGESKSTVPVGSAWTESQRSHLKEYMKIIDGIVYQPGTWEENIHSSSPYMDLTTPNMHKQGTVRLNISEKLDQDVYLIITGWTHRQIVAGASKLDSGSVGLIHPWNGDFLGSERFPWAVKIMFVVPTQVMHILNDKAYIRELVKGSQAMSVTARPVIDMESVSLNEFYENPDVGTYPNAVSASKVPMNVTELNVTGDGASVLAGYQRKDISSGSITGVDYPPVLYGSKVTEKGDQYIVPLDVGAPGTVKMFDNKTKAIAYPKVIPNTYSFYHDKDNHNVYLIEGDDLISLDTKLETKNLGTASSPKYTSIIKSGRAEVRALSLMNADNTMLDTSGSSGRIAAYEEKDASASDRNLSWDDLLTALGANKVIDLIGDELHRFRKNLPNVTSGDGGVLKITGDGGSSIAGSLTVDKSITTKDYLDVKGSASVAKGATVNRGTASYNMTTTDSEFSFNKPIKSGADYIEFNNGLRLYISATAPSTSGVPVGSIGIGW